MAHIIEMNFSYLCKYQMKTLTSISRDPGNIIPGIGMRKKSGIPGISRDGNSREGTLNITQVINVMQIFYSLKQSSII